MLSDCIEGLAIAGMTYHGSEVLRDWRCNELLLDAASIVAVHVLIDVGGESAADSGELLHRLHMQRSWFELIVQVRITALESNHDPVGTVFIAVDAGITTTISIRLHKIKQGVLGS